MHLVRVTPTNLRAFWNSDPIDVAPGVTLLFGKNNSGKTTLLEALGTAAAEGVHHGPKNLSAEGEPLNRTSLMELELQIEPSDSQEFLRTASEYMLLDDPQNIGQVDEIYRYHDSVLSSSFSIKVLVGSSGMQPQVLPSYVTLNRKTPLQLAFQEQKSVSLLRFRRNSTDARGYNLLGFETITWPQIHGHELSFQLFQRYKSCLFRSQAERRPDPQATITFETELAPDARNLVTVLHMLVSERERFSRYEAYVQRILPEVGEILSVPTGIPGVTQIRVAMSERKGRRDLAHSLTEIGTGAVQVLALVYAITMSKTRRLIVLDEPTAYLHPGATRELLKLVAEFDLHQYIIGTHMPIALDMLSAPLVVLLERTAEGTVHSRTIDHRETSQQRLLLREIGSSLQDVFGADHVIWVEGPTEAEVYRLLTLRMPQLPRGIVILPVIHTGDFQRREGINLAEIYERLSTGGGMLPNKVSFIFDMEGRSDRDIKELQRRTSKRIFFMHEEVE